MIKFLNGIKFFLFCFVSFCPIFSWVFFCYSFVVVFFICFFFCFVLLLFACFLLLFFPLLYKLSVFFIDLSVVYFCESVNCLQRYLWHFDVRLYLDSELGNWMRTPWNWVNRKIANITDLETLIIYFICFKNNLGQNVCENTPILWNQCPR